MPTTTTERRVSIAIVAAVLGTILASILGAFALVFAGYVDTDLSIEGTISVSGAIPVSWLLIAILAGLGGIVYISLTGIYGTDHVREAAEDATEIAQEAQDTADDATED